MRFLILTLLAAACPLTAVAAIYSWTDTQGRQHFSDDPLLAERHAGVLYQPGTPSASSTPLVRPQPRNTSRKTPRPSTSKANSRERRASASISANKACQRYERQIDALTRKLRRAHSNRQGNQWREQRRFYQHKRWQSCS